MELSQLKYFKCLAETKSLIKSAEKLYISPPALSMSINKLESELGYTLFERSNGKPLKLNERGQVLLESADKIFDILNNTLRTIDEMNSSEVV